MKNSNIWSYYLIVFEFEDKQVQNKMLPSWIKEARKTQSLPNWPLVDKSTERVELKSRSAMNSDHRTHAGAIAGGPKRRKEDRSSAWNLAFDWTNKIWLFNLMTSNKSFSKLNIFLFNDFFSSVIRPASTVQRFPKIPKNSIGRFPPTYSRGLQMLTNKLPMANANFFENQQNTSNSFSVA